MKIDEECINHNALRLIKEIVGLPFEYNDQNDDSDHMRLVTIGFVRGVIELADALKEAVKV